MVAPQPGVSGARACAHPPIARQPAIKVRKIAKVRVSVKTQKLAPPTPQVSAMQLVLGGGHPELVELIMGLIEPDPHKDPKEAQEQAMQGVLSWSSLNRKHRALFHDSHLKWWVALLKKHVGLKDEELKLGRSVVPHTTGAAHHACFVAFYGEMVRDRKERERKEAEAKANAEAKMALWEAERGISIRRAEEHADHFENTDQYQRWMFHTTKRDPRELELTKTMQRAERLLHHPRHEEDKSQTKERQEMGKLLIALRTRRREWEVFRTSPKPFTQMLATLAEAVRAMETAMGISTAPPSPPSPDPESEEWLHIERA